jgi:hypothetical protein
MKLKKLQLVAWVSCCLRGTSSCDGSDVWVWPSKDQLTYDQQLPPLRMCIGSAANRCCVICSGVALIAVIASTVQACLCACACVACVWVL